MKKKSNTFHYTNKERKKKENGCTRLVLDEIKLVQFGYLLDEETVDICENCILIKSMVRRPWLTLWSCSNLNEYPLMTKIHRKTDII